MQFTQLAKEGKIGAVTVRNRVIFPAMAVNMADGDGYMTDMGIGYYTARARGGCGLLVVEAVQVDKDWPLQITNQYRIYADEYIAGFEKLANSVHAEGAKIICQLWHPGNQTMEPCEGLRSINDLSVEDITDIKEKYVAAALRLQKAGLDGAEIQLCHGYLLSQFLSPVTNQRTDDFGGSLENRLRLAVQIIEGIRAACGKEYLVSVKLNGKDFIPGGFDLEEALEAAPMIEKAGADIIVVSAGTYAAFPMMIENAMMAEAWKTPLAKYVKNVVSIPVAAVGVIRHADVAEDLLARNYCDFVCIGRNQITDPDWVNHALSGNVDEIKPCISCLNCLVAPKGLDECYMCTVNPEASREYRLPPLKKDGAGKTAVVIGGGPGGMESARLFALRGFQTVLFEQSSELGGMMCLAEKTCFKEKITWLKTYYKGILEKLGVQIHLNKKATVEAVKALDPYVVVYAAGSEEFIPNIPGIDGPNVKPVRSVLRGIDKMMMFNKKVIVIGAGATGIETGEKLVMAGNAVTVLEMRPTLMPEGTYDMDLMIGSERIKSMGVDIQFNRKVLEICPGKVIAEAVETGETVEYPADMVILSIGTKARKDLKEDLEAAFDNVVYVGDCDKAGKIGSAIYAAYNKCAQI